MSEIVKTNPGSPLCDTVIQVSFSVKYIHCILYRPVQVFEFQINVDGVGALLPVFFVCLLFCLLCWFRLSVSRFVGVSAFYCVVLLNCFSFRGFCEIDQLN